MGVGDRLEDVPIVLAPLGVARDPPGVQDALERFGEAAVAGGGHIIAPFVGLFSVGGAVVGGGVVGLVGAVVPGPT